MDPLSGHWNGVTHNQGHRRYTCGHCGGQTGTKEGIHLSPTVPLRELPYVYICGGCNRPSFFEEGIQIPPPPFGRIVEHLPGDVERLWRETLGAARAGAYTAAVLVARTLIMHVAVTKGAAPGLQFVVYVNHLADNHHVPEGARPWLDHIRELGNAATHRLDAVSPERCREAIAFTEALLQMVYEFPGRLAATTGGVPPPATG